MAALGSDKDIVVKVNIPTVTTGSICTVTVRAKAERIQQLLQMKQQ